MVVSPANKLDLVGYVVTEQLLKISIGAGANGANSKTAHVDIITTI